MKRLLLLFAILHSAFVIPAVAQVPNLTSYQGRVAVGTVNFDSDTASHLGLFKFALVNGTGPALLWKNDGSSGNTEPADAVALTVTKGLYSVLLGDTSLANMTAIPGTVWANADVRLRVWFSDGTANGFQLLTPDQRITPSSYLADGSVASAALATGAVTNSKIANLAVDTPQLASGAVTNGKIASGAVTISKLGSGIGVWSVNGADIYRSSGYVSIGTSTPASPLTVQTAAGNSYGITHTDGTVSLGTYIDTTGAWLGTRSNHPLKFFTNESWEQMTLATNGNFGIGTTSPDDKLHVVGGSIRIGSPDGAVNDSNLVLSRNQIALPFINPPGGNTLASSSLTISTTKGNIILSPSGNGVVGGNVGIGTVSPKALLHVNGDYYGKGHVWLHANEGDGLDGTAYVQARDDSGTSSIGLVLRTQNAGNLTDAVTLDSEGRVTMPRGSLLLGNNASFGSYAAIYGGGPLNSSPACGLIFGTTPGGGQPTVYGARIEPNGHVKIGSVTDSALLSVGPGTARTRYSTSVGYYGSDTFNWGITDNHSSGLNSIYASNEVVAQSFVAFSDERIKNIKGRSDSAADLGKLRGIEITDYFYKDVIGKGNRPQKKVVAQQVEKVFSQAVSKTTDVVPDIYKLAPIKDGWITIATNLKAGERVKLITDGEESVHEVLETKDTGFRTDFKPAVEKVFVFGREVKDFRTVDYEAISMLNVSATQELARQLDVKNAEIAALKKQLADQDAAMKALAIRQAALGETLEARLAKLEQGSSAAGTQNVKVALKK